MSKPDHIKWVTDDDAAKISDPGTTKKLAGWIYTERPPFQFLNWLFNRAHKWFMGLQGGYFDIVVGSSTQVTNLEATHVAADLDDALVVAGSKVLFLSGTHTLAANIALTNDDISIVCESTEAIIDVATFTFTLSGLRAVSNVRFSNAGVGDVILSGAGSSMFAHDMNIDRINASAGVSAETSGANAGKIFNGNRMDFAPGTKMLFQQTTAPLGWTKDTTHNNKALRIVSGSASSGGSKPFTTTFGSSKTTDNHSLAISEIPAHDHPLTNHDASGGSTGEVYYGVGGATSTSNTAIGNTGGGGAHSHPLSSFDLQYVDFIIAVKN